MRYIITIVIIFICALGFSTAAQAEVACGQHYSFLIAEIIGWLCGTAIGLIVGVLLLKKVWIPRDMKRYGLTWKYRERK
jgi:hypothetical protein